MDDQEPLVRAMPRRPLYTLRGFVGKIDLEVLSAVSDEGWCATREAIAGEVDSKEVRIGVVVVRRAAGGHELLVGNGKEALRLVDIPPEAGGLGDFKRLAMATAAAWCPGVRGVEMAGYYNDDVHAEWRRVFVIIYRATLPPDAAVPEGAVWCSRSALSGLGLPEAMARITAGVCC